MIIEEYTLKGEAKCRGKACGGGYRGGKAIPRGTTVIRLYVPAYGNSRGCYCMSCAHEQLLPLFEEWGKRIRSTPIPKKTPKVKRII